MHMRVIQPNLNISDNTVVVEEARFRGIAQLDLTQLGVAKKGNAYCLAQWQSGGARRVGADMIGL